MGTFVFNDKVDVLLAATRVAKAHATAQQKLMWEALREAVDEEMEADPRVCLMGESCPPPLVSLGTSTCHGLS